ncbi:hypothetical protein [Corynebacterium sp. LK2510]|uniref:hypothetical protein n=1 Tax=Corynebacterium sp. LK2510 TaxID=3110472 RepID=UPI0034CE790A
MTSSTARTAAAGFFAVAALGLAACSPPGEVDSAQKIDTATSQNAAANTAAQQTSTGATGVSNVGDAATATATTVPAGTVPVLRNCGEAGQTEPQRIVLSCADQDDFIQDITWTQWTPELAVGTGTRVTVNPDRVVEETPISLGAAQMIDGELQFSTVTVDGVTVNPESNAR